MYKQVVFMFRTQVYLTQNEREKLNFLSIELGKNQSTLIREAIDQFIENQLISKRKKSSALKEIAGLWANRDDLPDFNELRKEFDRE
jgi:hypothetical protein